VDNVEVALVAFLSSDPDILARIRTAPKPPRIYPDKAPQGEPRSLACLVYEKLSHQENFALALGPDGLPDALFLLECRAGTRKEAEELRTLVLNSRGGNPDNHKLNGFAGSLGAGYTVQKVMAVNGYYDVDLPVKAEDTVVHIASTEIALWWNNI
jgi:hypothetical protein